MRIDAVTAWTSRVCILRSKKTVIRASFCGCLVILLVIGGLFARFRKDYLGEKYQGRKLAAWVADLSFHDEADPENSQDANKKKQEAAQQSVLHYGTNALPLALRLCRVENSTLELKLMDWCDELNSKQSALYLDHGISCAKMKWEQGLNIFRVLGSNAAPAIPTLIGYLGRNGSAAANNATMALGYIGPEAIPPLLVALTNNNRQTKRLAAFALSHFGTNSIAATPVLLRYIREEKGALADMSAYSLAKINDDPNILVPALTQHLNSTADILYSVVVFSKLGSFGTNAASAAPMLIEMIESNRRTSLVPRAISALIQIDPERGNFYKAKREANLKTNQPATSSYR